jgi:hypothetical protein
MNPMWTRRRIASITAALTALALLAWLTFHSSEPSYHGKSLSAWLEQARQSTEFENAIQDNNRDTPSARAVRAMGKDALPSLIRMAHTRDTRLCGSASLTFPASTTGLAFIHNLLTIFR